MIRSRWLYFFICSILIYCWFKRLDCIGQVRIPPREMLNYYSFIDIFFAMGKALQAEPIKTGEGQDSPGVEEREPEREVS
ncbi:MAG: hypothetical protein OXF20_08240 [Gammaproteobacteria bacterium]|nr:hypothetical protein [Gammaproteobacteria bacterium]